MEPLARVWSTLGIMGLQGGMRTALTVMLPHERVNNTQGHGKPDEARRALYCMGSGEGVRDVQQSMEGL